MPMRAAGETMMPGSISPYTGNTGANQEVAGSTGLSHIVAQNQGMAATAYLLAVHFVECWKIPALYRISAPPCIPQAPPVGQMRMSPARLWKGSANKLEPPSLKRLL